MSNKVDPIESENNRKKTEFSEDVTNEEENFTFACSVIEEVNSNGPWFWVVLLFVIISYQQAYMLFEQYGSLPGIHYCRIKALDSFNWTAEDKKLFSVSFKANDSTQSSCMIYDLPYQHTPHDFDAAVEWRNKYAYNGTDLPVTSCNDNFYVDKKASPYEESIVNEFELFCQKTTLQPLANTVFMVGLMLGLLFSGFPADKFGRRKAIIIEGIGVQIFGPLVSLAPNYIIYCVLRFFAAFFFMALGTTAWIYIVELSGPSNRLKMRILTKASWAISCIAFVGFAKMLQNWRFLHLSMNIPSIFLFVVYFVIPESPLWLILQKKYGEALDILIKIGNYNKRPLCQESIIRLKRMEMQFNEKNKMINLDSTKRAVHPLILMQNSALRRITLAISFNWFTVGMVYYGFLFANVRLPGDVYFNGLLSALTEVVQLLLYVLCTLKFGWKFQLLTYTVLLTIFSASTGLLLAINMDEVLNIPILIIATLGKLCVGMNFVVLYIYTAELYPTAIRNMGFAACSMIARIGSALAPYIITLDTLAWRPLPQIIFSVIAAIASALILMLPDTTNKQLLQTIDDVSHRQVEQVIKSKLINEECHHPDEVA